MKKITFIICLLALLSANTQAQTLFSFDHQKVSVQEFLKAFQKNNPTVTKNKTKAIQDYLELYINSRLKIHEATVRGYDTLSQIKTEMANLRSQISGKYMHDQDLLNRLTTEAFQRSQKDIHVAHIFIAFQDKNGFNNKAAADKKRDLVLQRLQKGDDFLQVAKELSDDTTSNKNGGDIGYITVFSLPYPFENAVYATPVGKYSTVVASHAGYHIFKNLGERKAMGKIKAQQILLAFPPGIDAAGQQKMKQLADSLYDRLQAGDDFSKLATTFSNDYITANNNGNMPEISVGMYAPSFEEKLATLKKDGAISRPFKTAYGWHIVKRIAVTPVVSDAENEANKLALQEKIKADSRWDHSQDFIFDIVKNKIGMKNYPIPDPLLWSYTDSILNKKPMPPAGRKIQSTDPLLTIGDSTLTIGDWIKYAQTHRFKKDGSGPENLVTVKNNFFKQSMLDYYQSHLEKYNEKFGSQMKEFKDGNLFFEMMQREIWNKAQTNLSALQEIYQKNKSKFQWGKSVDAIIFYCTSLSAANTAHALIQKDPIDWRDIVNKYSNQIIVDSTRLEWSQIQSLKNTTPTKGLLTKPVVHISDNSASFAYILQVFDKPTPRSFEESKGMLVNMYQQTLEENLDRQLRKKYPVTIHQKELDKILH